MIGFLGPVGTFTHVALNLYLADARLNTNIQSYPSVFSLFQALKNNNVDKILVPIENSFGGDVYAANEGLLNLTENNLIHQEILLTIHQSLMSNKQCHITDITKLYAHEQSVRQCERFLQTYLPDVEVIACSSNAQAAKIVAESSDIVACLGHKQLCSNYKLQLLQEKVNDFSSNVTRFLLISKENSIATGNDKTSIVFSTIKDRPGSLCEILQLMSSRSINLTRISSRPSKKILGEYLFFIDCEGHIGDEKIAQCLDLLQKQSSYYKFLGSYQKGKHYD
tara:strand:+ start:247 stop:1086 length:840 start_codon:yes stop_codon:yes gene_type:complete